MVAFLDAVLRNFLEAADLLRRRASGDYWPDEHLQTLPVYAAPNSANGPKRSKSSGGTGKTCYELFGAYVAATKAAPVTVTAWRGVFIALDAHLKSNGWHIGNFGPEEAQRWSRFLVNGKRSASTVKTKYVGAAHSVLAWAVREKLIPANPFADVSIDVPRKKQIREDGKAFSEAEQRTILREALAIGDAISDVALLKLPNKSACRWIPWLCAYSGARAGEITQPRGQDIEQRGGCVVMKLTPEAGTTHGVDGARGRYGNGLHGHLQQVFMRDRHRTFSYVPLSSGQSVYGRSSRHRPRIPGS
jgi:hypothetical protein